MPKATFDFDAAVVTDYAAKVSAESLDFGTLPFGTNSTLEVTVKNRGQQPITPVVSGLETPFSTTYTAAELTAGETATIPVTFNPAEVGSYTGTMTIDCGQAGTFSVALTGGSARMVTVCGTNTTTNYYLPIYSTYYSSAGKNGLVIYPAEMLASLVGQDITQVKFFTTGIGHSGGKLAVKMAEVDVTTPTSLDQFDDVMTTVKGDYVENQDPSNEITITFDVPFHYNGGNLAILTEVVEAGTAASYSSYTNYVGQNQSTTVGRYRTYSGSSTSSFLPKAEFSYQEPADYAAAVSPTALDFSSVPVGNSKTLEVTVTNTGANAFTPSLSALEAPFSTTAQAAELASGAKLVIPVTYSPADASESNATLTIDCGEAGTTTVTMTGKGLVVPTGYQETFDGVTASSKVPAGWKSYQTNQAWRNDHSFTSDLSQTDASLSVYDNDGVKGLTTTATNYFLVSPKVNGDIAIAARLVSAQSSPNLQVMAFPVTDGKIMAASGHEYTIEWIPALSTAEVSYGFFHVDEPTQVAVRFASAAIDLFAADEMIAEKEIAMVSATAPTPVAAEGNTAHMSISAVVKNTGLAPVEAADYQFVVTRVGVDGEIATIDGVDIAVGEQAEATLEFDYVITDIQPSQYVTFAVQETMKNTKVSTSTVNVTAAVPMPVLYLENGTTTYSKQDMGVFRGSRDLKVTIGNKNGTTDLTYTITPVEGVTVDVAEGTVAIGGVSDVITFTVTAPVVLDGVIANITTNGAPLTVEAHAAGLAETTFLEDFEDDLDNGWIVDEGVTFPARPGATDFNQKAAYVYAINAVADPANIVTPAILFNEETGLDFHFTTYRQLYGGSVQAYYSTDRAEWTSLGDVATVSSQYVNHTFTLPEAGTYYFKFVDLGCYIDDIYGGERAVVEHDAFFESFDGPSDGMVNKSSTFTGTLRNLAAAEDFDIVLKVDDEVVATETINVDGRANFTFDYMPHAVGTYTVTAEASTAGFVVASQAIEFTVAEESAVNGVIVNNGTSLTVTTGQNESIISSYYEHTFSRMLYTAEQLAAAGVKPGDKITKVAFLLSKNERTYDLDFNVWARNTEATAVSGTTIYSSEDGFDKVYENSSVIGLIPAAGGEMLLELSSPITYTGNSLEFVTATYGDYQSKYIQFYYNSVSGQMIRYRSDGSVSDYEATMASVTGSASSQLPSIKLYIEAEPAVVSGVVTNEAGEAIEGAELTMANEAGVTYNATTDAEGAYTLNVIQAGEGYTLTVKAEGYEDYTETLDITEDMTKNIELATPATVVTLAEALAGEENVEYLISDELIVATVQSDGTVILTDNQGNWIGTTISEEMRETLRGANSLKNVRGTVSNLNTNPVITFTVAPVEGESTEDAVLETLNLHESGLIDLPGNCLAQISGFYGTDGMLRAFSNPADPGQKLAIDDTFMGEGALNDYVDKNISIVAIVRLNEAWEAEEETPAGAPRRVKKSDMNSASNYTIVPLEGTGSTDITTGTADVKAYGEVESVEYYNAAGMKSSKPFSGINIVVTHYTDGTVSTTKVVK
ncbi:MAG: choice-of-anchor D domain-containing protein [Muribaculaceae bacterium]|nr:choice-of-anchor D domain-containing protein [Muribaculaceae bacterium]